MGSRTGLGSQAKRFPDFVEHDDGRGTELLDNDGTGNPHHLDHRSYASTTSNFKEFSVPKLFYSPEDPAWSVIGHDDRGTSTKADDRCVMIIKNEMYEKDGGKNLRIVSSRNMQGPYKSKLGPPIVETGTNVVNRMGEGPSLNRHNGEWRLYCDAPGSNFFFCLATSPNFKTWTNQSHSMKLPVAHMRHETVL